MPNVSKSISRTSVKPRPCQPVKILLTWRPRTHKLGGVTKPRNKLGSERASLAAWGIDGLKVDVNAGDPYDLSVRLPPFCRMAADARRAMISRWRSFTARLARSDYRTGDHELLWRPGDRNWKRDAHCVRQCNATLKRSVPITSLTTYPPPMSETSF